MVELRIFDLKCDQIQFSVTTGRQSADLMAEGLGQFGKMIVEQEAKLDDLCKEISDVKVELSLAENRLREVTKIRTNRNEASGNETPKVSGSASKHRRRRRNDQTRSTGQDVRRRIFVSQENNSSSSYDNLREEDNNIEDQDDNDED